MRNDPAQLFALQPYCNLAAIDLTLLPPGLPLVIFRMGRSAIRGPWHTSSANCPSRRNTVACLASVPFQLPLDYLCSDCVGELGIGAPDPLPRRLLDHDVQ